MKSTVDQLHDSQQLSNSLLNCLDLNIAIIDYSGTIIHVNSAWKQFAVDNGLLSSTVGANYFRVCDKANDTNARKAVNGIYKVISSEIESFSMEYDCHSPDENRWFLMTVNPICNLETNLFMVVHTDITKRIEYENKLMQSQNDLRLVTDNAFQIRETELKNISRELHDSLGHTLTDIKLMLNQIKIHLSTELDENDNMQFKKTFQLIDKSIHQIRDLSTRIRPDILDDLGLAATLEWEFQKFIERTGVEVNYAIDQSIEVNEKLSINIYRIVQETLTNIARHAKANRIHAILQIVNNSIYLSIEDDGQGFNLDEAQNSLGIMGLKERALLCGGQVNIKSKIGHGVTVELNIPLNSNNRENS
ncbi:sensor histidine kinase [bacterium]|nr:sensor histidine kinase [bacterium]